MVFGLRDINGLQEGLEKGCIASPDAIKKSNAKQRQFHPAIGQNMIFYTSVSLTALVVKSFHFGDFSEAATRPRELRQQGNA